MQAGTLLVITPINGLINIQKWATGVKETLLLGVISPFKTVRGPSWYALDPAKNTGKPVDSISVKVGPLLILHSPCELRVERHGGLNGTRFQMPGCSVLMILIVINMLCDES